jgi:hypothetical protein
VARRALSRLIHERFQVSTDPGVGQEPAESSEPGGPGARIDGATGVQVGSGNLQVNNYYVPESSPKQPPKVVRDIPALVRGCLLEPPQPSSLRVIQHGKTLIKYREMHILEQDEDLIAIWNYEKGLHVTPLGNFAFTSRGIRIFQCNIITGYSRRRVFIPYQDFRKHKFGFGLSLSVRFSGYLIRITGPQECRISVAALWRTHAQLVVNDLNHIRDLMPGE